MSDNDPTAPANGASPLDELEKLVLEAEIAEPEAFTTTDSVLTPPTTMSMTCAKCGGATHHTCPTCHGPVCALCASPLDPNYCRLCLDEPGAELTASPLKSRDDDGVVHQGRLLTPGPTFGTMCKRIADMSDYELDAHVGHYKDLIHQAEISLDFRRVVLGAGQLEQAQRGDAKRRALRGIKMPTQTKAAKAVAGGTPKSARAAKPPLLDMMKALEMLQALGKL